jgi:hypothetical protein
MIQQQLGQVLGTGCRVNIGTCGNLGWFYALSRAHARRAPVEQWSGAGREGHVSWVCIAAEEVAKLHVFALMGNLGVV